MDVRLFGFLFVPTSVVVVVVVYVRLLDEEETQTGPPAYGM